MANNILLLAGDGVGPEVMAEVKKIIDWLNKNKKTDIEISEELVGGASYDENKTPLTDEVLYKAMDSDAVLLGAVGGPKYDKLDFAKRPERALLRLRKEMRLFANLRPAICFSELVSTSTLKPEIISDLDIMIVRELTGGVYFGEPRGIKPLENDERDISYNKNVVGLTFPEAVKVCFKKYFNFKDRASRSEYWYFTLFGLIVYAIGFGLMFISYKLFWLLIEKDFSFG